MANWVKLEKQLTLINIFWAFYNLLSISHSLTVRIWLNVYSSPINTSFFISSLCKVLTLQNELVKKVLIEELQSLNQILTVKERDTDYVPKKTRKTLINVSCFLIIFYIINY